MTFGYNIFVIVLVLLIVLTLFAGVKTVSQAAGGALIGAVNRANSMMGLFYSNDAEIGRASCRERV